MRRDNGAHIALGALAALTALGALVQGRGSRAKGPPDEGQVRQGKIRRALKRAADQANGDVASFMEISEETGFSEPELEAEAEVMTRSGGYYIDESQEISNARGIGKIHPLRQKLIGILNRNMDSDPELGVRTVDLVIRLMPSGADLRSSAGLMSSRELLEEDLRIAAPGLGYPEPEPGDEMRLYAKIYADKLRDRTFFKMGDPSGWDNYNLDAEGSRFDGIRYLSWLESLMRDFIALHGADAPLASVEELAESWSDISDWASVERVDLTGMSLDQANEAQTEWHRTNQNLATAAEIERKRKDGKWFDCPDGVHPIKSRQVYRYDNGWTWQEIGSWKELQNEGNFSKGGGCLKHCIGEGDSYLRAAQTGRQRHFSLRTPENRPMLTATIEYMGERPVTLNQLKGLSNRRAGEAGSGGEIVAVLRRAGAQFAGAGQQAYLDAEVSMVEEFFEAQGLPRNGVDYNSVLIRLADIERRKKAAEKDGSPNRWPQYQRTIAGYRPRPQPFRRRPHGKR
jgi:hypothetical protein